MGLSGRFSRTFNAFRGRVKIGTLQGGLKYNLKSSGVDSPRAQHFASQIAETAWNIHMVSEFFQSLGLSFEDYAVMYNAAVRACPNMLIENRNLIATFLLIDNFRNFQPGFHAYSQAVSGQMEDKRARDLEVLITSMVNDVVCYKGKALSPLTP